jgi:subtilisin-like proprotein convertase family protein
VKLGLACLFSSFLLVACGPSVQPDGADDTSGDDAPEPDADSCVASAEVCDNQADEDCDGFVDCADVDCYGLADCPTNPNCGEAGVEEGEPLALPDGEGGSYVSTINITGFSDGQFLEQATDFLGICVNMEHSWIRDLQMEMTCPSGVTLILNEFLGQTGGQVFLGIPNDSDDITPVPGVGWDYCWTPTATNAPMLDYANQFMPATLPAGDYQSSDPMNLLEGCTLNGDWSIRVTDLWGIDNGYIFSWGISFDPAIVEDCEDWPVD